MIRTIRKKIIADQKYLWYNTLGERWYHLPRWRTLNKNQIWKQNRMLLVFVLKCILLFNFRFEITKLACFSLEFSTNIFKCIIKCYSVLWDLCNVEKESNSGRCTYILSGSITSSEFKSDLLYDVYLGGKHQTLGLVFLTCKIPETEWIICKTNKPLRFKILSCLLFPTCTWNFQ